VQVCTAGLHGACCAWPADTLNEKAAARPIVTAIAAPAIPCVIPYPEPKTSFTNG